MPTTPEEAQKILRRFLKDGCGLSVPGVFSSPTIPDVAKIIGRRVFWVDQFGLDGRAAHAGDFDRIETVGDVGLAFYSGDDIAVYFAPWVEWPGFDIDAARAARNRWREYLENERNREAWNAFVEQEERVHVG